MITAIEIENFKAIRDRVRVEFKPITLLFGPNSAGKSTIVQALHYAREILERHNLDPDRTMYGGDAVELGGFRNLVHNHDVERSIVLRFDLDLHEVDLPEYGVTSPVVGFPHKLQERLSRETTSAWVQLTSQWSTIVDGPQITLYEVGLNGEIAGRIRASLDRTQVGITEINFRHPLFCAAVDTSDQSADAEAPVSILEELHGELFPMPIEGGLGLLGLRSAVPQLDELLNLDTDWTEREFDDKFESYSELVGILTQALVGPATLLREELRQFRYLGPLRKIPPRNYEPSRTRDEARWASGLGAWDALHRNGPQFVRAVSDWLSRADRLDAGYELRLKQYKELDAAGPLMLSLSPDRALDDIEDLRAELEKLPTKSRLVLVEGGKEIEILPPDIGVGVSQVLPVVVAALDDGSGIVAIEQPELHIHPAIQVNLGDLFISQVSQSKGKNQTLVPESDLGLGFEDMQGQDFSATFQQSRRLLDVGAIHKTFLLETHSEHLLLRLLRRIRETATDELPPGATPLRPEQIAVFYVEQTPDGARLSKLRVDETGEFIDRWPKGFFEERVDEIL